MTATLALDRPTQPLRIRLGARAAGLLLLAAAFAIRLPDLGNPAFLIDEQFYLLVGDHLLHGSVPFVDIWDRKPIGLFVLYAAIRLLGGDGILQYQLVATVFAGATAWIICRIAERPAGRFGGVIAGLCYLLWIETMEGGGGQAPIFYNLFVAGAAALTLRAGDCGEPARFRAPAFAAMALIGIAIQIKYTAVFEGFYFGLLLAWWTLRRARSPLAAIGQTIALAATALAPTIAAFACYAAIGQAEAFWFANFASIFLRAPADPAAMHERLVQIALHFVPLTACFAAGLYELRADRDAVTRRWQWIVAGWLVAALAGLCAVGAFYVHYALPMFVPLTVAAAPIFRRRPLGWVMGGLALWLPASGLDYPDFAATHRARNAVERLEALVPAGVDRGCMQMFAGPPILYLRTHACFVTPYVFPDHLVSAVETHAIGVDPREELRRVFGRRPRVIVTNDAEPLLDRASDALLRRLRDADYRRAGRVMIDGRPIDLWVSR